MSAHTPGPWKDGRVTAPDPIIEGGPLRLVMSDGCIVAFVPMWLDDDHEADEARKNARLISASPDLYAALVNARSFIATDRASMVECCTGPNGEVDEYDASAIATYDELLAQIDAAIVKAGGELETDEAVICQNCESPMPEGCRGDFINQDECMRRHA